MTFHSLGWLAQPKMVGKSPNNWIGFVGKILTGNHGFSREDHGWLDSGNSSRGNQSFDPNLWNNFSLKCPFTNVYCM